MSDVRIEVFGEEQSPRGIVRLHLRTLNERCVMLEAVNKAGGHLWNILSIDAEGIWLFGGIAKSFPLPTNDDGGIVVIDHE